MSDAFGHISSEIETLRAALAEAKERAARAGAAIREGQAQRQMRIQAEAERDAALKRAEEAEQSSQHTRNEKTST